MTRKRRQERPTTPRDITPIIVNGVQITENDIPDIIPSTPTVSVPTTPLQQSIPEEDSHQDEMIIQPARSLSPTSPIPILNDTNMTETLQDEQTENVDEDYETVSENEETIQEQTETLQDEEPQPTRGSPYHINRRNALVNLGFASNEIPIPDSPSSVVSDLDIAGVGLEPTTVSYRPKSPSQSPVQSQQRASSPKPSPTLNARIAPISTSSPLLTTRLSSPKVVSNSPKLVVNSNPKSSSQSIPLPRPTSPKPVNPISIPQPETQARPVSPKPQMTAEQEYNAQPYQRSKTNQYDHLPKYEQIRHREMFKHKFAIVKEMNPAFNPPDLENTPLDELHVHYEECLRQIQFKKNVGHHKLFLIVGLIIVELILVKGLGLNMGGFTLNQLSGISRYDFILLQLGEYEIVSVPDEWPIWAQLSFMVLIQAVIFWFVKWVSGMFGKEAGSFVQNVADNIHGVVQKGGDILGNMGGNNINLGSLLSMASAFMGNNNNSGQQSNQKPPMQPMYRD